MLLDYGYITKKLDNKKPGSDNKTAKQGSDNKNWIINLICPH
jgi:hypothetical protein